MKQLSLFGLLSLLIFISPSLAQTKTQTRPPGMTRLQKLAQIDSDIAWYEGQERKGTWLLVGGLAASLLSIPTMIPDEDGEVNFVSFSLLNTAGVALMWWGFTTRWDSQEYLRLLRVKRYDFTMLPLYLPEQGGATGLLLTTRF